MDGKTLSPPQEKSVSGKPDVNVSKKQILALIKQFNIDPNTIIQIGDLAEQAIKDKTLYPVLKENAIRSGMMDESDFGKGIDYQMLAVLATLSRMAKDMIKRGELRG